MKWGALFLAAGLCSCSSVPSTEVEKPANAQAHIDAAYALAGDSFMRKTVDLQCTKSVNPMSFFKNPEVLPPTQVFDNLYFVGLSSVAAWAIKTSDGIILIDALNNTEQASTIIETGFRRLGLDPSEIKYIVVTHGHGDHYGGARYLAEKYKSRVLMSDLDWDMAINAELPPKIPGLEPPKWSQAPDKDLVAGDGETLQLGDTTVTIIHTPGHTPGTISLIFPVLSQGHQHTAALWGGTGFPRDLPGVQSYISSTDKFVATLSRQNVDVALSNHPFVDDSPARMSKLAEMPSTNPFVIGTDAVQRFATILSECAKAELLQRQAR